MANFAWLLPLALAAWAFDRLMSAAEARGWVYWRRHRSSGSRFGTAMLSVQAILEPDKEHVVEERAHEEADIDIAGDDAPIGGDAPTSGRAAHRSGSAAEDDLR